MSVDSCSLPCFADECGIVAQVSAPLAKAAISTYYICTFDTDHTLVCVDMVLHHQRITSPLSSFPLYSLSLSLPLSPSSLSPLSPLSLQVREGNVETALQLLNERYETTLLKLKASRSSSTGTSSNSAASDTRVPSLCTVSYTAHTAPPPPPPASDCDSDLQNNNTASTYSTISSDTASLTPFTDSKMCAMAT